MQEAVKQDPRHHLLHLALGVTQSQSSREHESRCQREEERERERGIEGRKTWKTHMQASGGCCRANSHSLPPEHAAAAVMGSKRSEKDYWGKRKRVIHHPDSCRIERRKKKKGRHDVTTTRRRRVRLILSPTPPNLVFQRDARERGPGKSSSADPGARCFGKLGRENGKRGLHLLRRLGRETGGRETGGRGEESTVSIDVCQHDVWHVYMCTYKTHTHIFGEGSRAMLHLTRIQDARHFAPKTEKKGT